MKLKFADNLDLPIECVTQTFAFLGKRGGGKTYAAQKLAELMLGANAQVVALDPIGVWYGLRLAADGKAKGFSIPVFGGEHGDVPLEPQAGALIAKLIVEERFSAILDVSTFRKNERKQFVTDFAEELLHRKKTNRSALHVFFEESQVFVPQKTFKGEERMLGAFEDLIKLGRNYGIGASLISQRPQAVNKDVLNQTEVLLAFQMTGPQERKTIEGWVADKGFNENLADILPSLKIGEAHLWSPQWLHESKTVRINKKTTYDASSTPTVGAAIIQPKELSPVDVEKIKSSIADVVKRAEATDPKKLQAEIRRLNAELKKAQTDIPKAVAQVATRVETKIKEVPVIKDAQLEKAKKLAESIDPIIEKLEAKLVDLREIRYHFVAGAEKVRLYMNEKRDVPERPERPKVNVIEHNPLARTMTVKRMPDNATHGMTVSGSLPEGEKKILTAIAQDGRGVTTENIAVLTGYKATSRRVYLNSLIRRGLIEKRDNSFFPTETGIAELGDDFTPLPTGPALQDHWLSNLPEGEKRIFQVILGEYPSTVSKDDIEAATGYKATSIRVYTNVLINRKIVERVSGGVKASDDLF